ncbi:aminotransferase class I/II-fold pyridoxal phosphate-dependent enzyme, partial [Candidatus Margulisiibacteriota bacterium]
EIIPSFKPNIEKFEKLQFCNQRREFLKIREQFKNLSVSQQRKVSENLDSTDENNPYTLLFNVISGLAPDIQKNIVGESVIRACNNELFISPLDTNEGKKYTEYIDFKNLLLQYNESTALDLIDYFREIYPIKGTSHENIVFNNEGSSGLFEPLYDNFIKKKENNIFIQLKQYFPLTKTLTKNKETNPFAFSDFEELQHWINYYYNTYNNFENCKMVFVFVNPGNPHGPYINHKEIHTLIKHYKNNEKILFIIDEAYADFCERKYGYTNKETADYFNGVIENGNTILVRTLSKLYGLPNIRYGYAIGNNKLINNIQKDMSTSFHPILEYIAKICFKKEVHQSYLKEIIDPFLKNTEILKNKYNIELKKHNNNYTRIDDDNTPFATLALGKDFETTALKLFYEWGIITQPGSIGYENIVRISLVNFEDRIKTPLLKRYIPREYSQNINEYNFSAVSKILEKLNS